MTTPGAVVSDVRSPKADLLVEAPNVTLRRVEFQGGVINNWPPRDARGLSIDPPTIALAPGQNWSDDTEGAISYGGYTATG